jgi:Leucine-rich repeat (LRR) protein
MKVVIQVLELLCLICCLSCLSGQFVGSDSVDTLHTGWTITPEEKSALKDFYDRLNGTFWDWDKVLDVTRRWNFATDPCTNNWYGVGCKHEILDASEQFLTVHSLNLTDFGLNGVIPSSISKLPSLEVLLLDDNNIRGSLEALEMLPNITTVSLFNNSVNGSLPAFKRSLNLSFLNLGSNNLSRTIPADLLMNPSLKNLNLESNRLNGSIPLIHGVNLMTLSLSDNYLDGLLPQTLNLPLLEYLDLSSNNFSGSIPNYDNLPSLKHLDISENKVTGSLPVLVNLINLEFFHAKMNSLSGSLPVFALTNLSEFDVSFHKITGSLPSFEQLPSLQVLDISRNQFVGSIPFTHFDSNPLLYSLGLIVNGFTGKMEFVTRIPHLQYMWTSENKFTGTIPDISHLQDLAQIYWQDNLLTGTIPESLCQLKNLVSVNNGWNYHTGTIPSCFSYESLPSLQVFDLAHAGLHGTIPTGLLVNPMIVSLGFDQNFLTGKIDALNCPELLVFNVQENHFEGPLPDFPARLLILSLASNYFTGTIKTPEETSSLLALDLSSNHLEGSMNECFFKIPDLNIIALANNSFSGILESVANLKDLQLIAIGDNSFSGDISKVLSPALSKLSYVDLSNNRFFGYLPNEWFAGSSDHLLTLVLTKNCLSVKEVPSVVCQAKNLVHLIMDGLSSADSCQNELFPHYIKSTYTISNTLRHSLPGCLFELPALKTLHLAGNGLIGTLPSDINISSSLKDLVLSHNQVKGSIPYSFQSHPWNTLDLSYNKLNGGLSEHFLPMQNNNESNIFLQINRLSGDLTGTAHKINAVNVAEGNSFSCQSNVPSQDPESDAFAGTCGSIETENALIIFYVVFTVFVISACCISFFKLYQRGVSNIVNIVDTNFTYYITSLKKVLFQALLTLRGKSVPELEAFCVKANLYHSCYYEILSTITFITSIIVFALGFLFVSMLIYAVAFVGYRTHSHGYVWDISFAHLSGWFPSLFMGFLVVLLFAYLSWLFGIKSQSLTKEKQPGSISLTDTVLKKFKFFFIGAILSIINFTIVAIVNVYYIFSIINNPHNRGLVQLGLSLFKMFWTYGVVLGVFLGVIRWHNRTNDKEGRTSPIERQIHLSKSGISLVSGILFLNIILIPILCEMIIDPNCFLYAIISPSEIQSKFSGLVSVMVVLFGGTVDEGWYTIDLVQQRSFSFIPPFNYSYQCSSSLLSSFVPPFIYSYLLSILMLVLLKLIQLGLKMNNSTPKWIPLVLLKFIPILPKQLCYEIEKRLLLVDVKNESSKQSDDHLFYLIEFNLSSLLGKKENERPSESEINNNTSSFGRDQFVLIVLNDFCVLFTFGIAFPLLGIVILLKLVVYVYFHGHLLLSLWEELNDHPNTLTFAANEGVKGMESTKTVAAVVNDDDGLELMESDHSECNRSTSFIDIEEGGQKEFDVRSQLPDEQDTMQLPVSGTDANNTSFLVDTQLKRLKEKYRLALIQDCTSLMDCLLFSFRSLPVRAALFLSFFLFDIIGDHSGFSIAVGVVPAFTGFIFLLELSFNRTKSFNMKSAAAVPYSVIEEKNVQEGDDDNSFALDNLEPESAIVQTASIDINDHENQTTISRM